MKPLTERRRPRQPLPRRRIYSVAVAAPVLALAVLLMPNGEKLRAAGPANTGHEQLACAQCHTPAEGTPRQQIQANVRYLLGLRATPADFIHEEVGNVDCQACHQNDDDQHPVYRFNEPRFAEARAELAPQYCVSCHAEHTGQRVTAEPTMCASCHADLVVLQDPIDPTHEALVGSEQWNTCLSCHDFHGNHVRTTPTRLEEGTPEEAIARYFAGGPPIYGTELRFPARESRLDP